MDSVNIEYSVGSGLPSSSAAPPSYETSSPNTTTRFKNTLKQRRDVCIRFFLSIYGILNIVIIIALVCVLISAGIASSDDARTADHLSGLSSTKVSAFHTRNAILVFASVGLLLILVDTFLQITGLIKRLPKQFDLIFTLIMLVLAAIFLILGCCSAAWGKKMSDASIGPVNVVWNTGCAAAAAAFLFVAMIATIMNFVLRLIRPIERGNDG
ncbi:unnamed protein product [Rotaria sp. Silwood1]|nr:unnamed protein product [Rotaria sp. Silwood1]CAF3789616.1 unnamed protein product [Rotaria sp. Silwood1]CAF3845799.1 unnamed protein product [Rotaria sp. Silwood1]CAF4840293.1 unnamed protein product [Rotaria sp. Silwood1]CAF4991754.1 unnamed protein product [Rotaria sp. Silwood1]